MLDEENKGKPRRRRRRDDSATRDRDRQHGRSPGERENADPVAAEQERPRGARGSEPTCERRRRRRGEPATLPTTRPCQRPRTRATSHALAARTAPDPPSPASPARLAPRSPPPWTTTPRRDPRQRLAHCPVAQVEPSTRHEPRGAPVRAPGRGVVVERAHTRPSRLRPSTATTTTARREYG